MLDPNIDRPCHPLAPYWPPAFRVPRQFSIGAIMLVTAAAALFLGALKTIQTPPWLMGLLALYMLLIALGQTFLFGGRSPITASIVVGIGYFLAVPFVYAVSATGLVLEALGMTLSGAMFLIPAGVLWGAIGGLVVGGLVMLVNGLGLGGNIGLGKPYRLCPFTHDDIPTLLDWDQQVDYRDFWSDVLTEEVLRERLSQTAADGASIVMLKLVDAANERMVGYCEISEINRTKCQACLRLAIIDPRSRRRGLLSWLLICGALEFAARGLSLNYLKTYSRQDDMTAHHAYYVSGLIEPAMPAPAEDVVYRRALLFGAAGRKARVNTAAHAAAMADVEVCYPPVAEANDETD